MIPAIRQQDEFNTCISRVKYSLAEYQRNGSARSNYFSALNDLALFEKFPPVRAFKNDNYIDIAGRVLRGDIYPICALQAFSYVRQLQGFEGELASPIVNRQGVRQKLSGVIKAHEAFIDALTPEFFRENRNRFETTSFIFPKTVRLFREVYQEKLDQLSPQQRQLAIQGISTDLILILPRLVLCKLLSDPRVEIPELLEKESLNGLRDRFARLGEQDRENLIGKLKGAPVNLSEAMSQFYGEIIELTSFLHWGEAPVFANLMRSLFGG
jgi:hypothetical protein